MWSSWLLNSLLCTHCRRIVVTCNGAASLVYPCWQPHYENSRLVHNALLSPHSLCSPYSLRSRTILFPAVAFTSHLSTACTLRDLQLPVIHCKTEKPVGNQRLCGYDNHNIIYVVVFKVFTCWRTRLYIWCIRLASYNCTRITSLLLNFQIISI